MPAVEKAFLEPEKGEQIPCLFNPTDFAVSKRNRWLVDRVPGRDAPELYFGGGEPGRLSVELLLDTTTDGKPVTQHTNRLFTLLEIDKSLPGHDPKTGRGRPPWVRFHWADFHSFKAVVEGLDVAFTYFGSDGTPLRAEASLELRQFEPDPQFAKQNPTSGTPEPHRVHVVQATETLDRIAAFHYGDAGRWRAIADANGITDPMRVEPGTPLTIPVLEGAGRGR